MYIIYLIKLEVDFVGVGLVFLRSLYVYRFFWVIGKDFSGLGYLVKFCFKIKLIVTKGYVV